MAIAFHEGHDGLTCTGCHSNFQKPLCSSKRRSSKARVRRSCKRWALEDEFSAADLLMTTVLRTLRDTDRVSSMPVLQAYQQRCEARPAFARALAAHMKPFAANAPAG
jgi:glutathione S-transferase